MRRDVFELTEQRSRPARKHSFERKQIAAAALLLRCAQTDRRLDPPERQTICDAIRRQFGLDDETCQALIAAAARRSEEVWHEWIFLETIKQGFTEQEQREILERLWEVAYADGWVHPFETHLIWRAARELGFSETVLEEARAKAQERTEAAPEAARR